MELNKIINGNAYELIKTIPDKSIDLIYTDIPYLFVDGGKGAGLLKNQTRHDLYSKTLEPIVSGIDYSILDQFCRVLKNIYIYMVFERANA